MRCLSSHISTLSLFALLSIGVIAGCKSSAYHAPPTHLLESMGKEVGQTFQRSASMFKERMKRDSTDQEAYLGYADMMVYAYIFGLVSRPEAFPPAVEALQAARSIDSTKATVYTLAGIIDFLDWNWIAAGESFRKSIAMNPNDPKTRHWYCLWLVSMKADYAQAMAHSDTIMRLDPSGDYQVGRGSLMYFERENEALKQLMKETIAKDPTVPWGYDWLGMAHIELKEYDASIEIYQKAFELSDGLVEVGGGLGHALGLAGAYEPAKYMADFYTEAAKTKYLPPVQRAFIHIGIGEYDQAIELLEQAYAEKSWFIIFIQVEPWYDPLRKDSRFLALVEKMDFPVKVPQDLGNARSE